MARTHHPNQIDYVELPAGGADDLARTKRFFADVFEWTFQDWGPAYADTDSSGIGSGINADIDHCTAAPLPVIYTRELDFVRARVLTSGGTITRETFAFPGGRRFHFKDPAGNELGVWSDQ